jgi:hypothetical protein
MAALLWPFSITCAGNGDTSASGLVSCTTVNLLKEHAIVAAAQQILAEIDGFAPRSTSPAN